MTKIEVVGWVAKDEEHPKDRIVVIVDGVRKIVSKTDFWRVVQVTMPEVVDTVMAGGLTRDGVKA